MILSKIKEFYASHRKTIFYTLVFGFLFYTSQDIAFASSYGGSAPSVDSKEDTVIKAVDYFLAIVSTLLGTLTGLISLLLNPGWVNGTIFGFETYLKDMWIMISNIVYFIFAFLLIAIAFMNIIGKGQDVWEMKQALPKFVIGVLIVPFSWFFVQLILSMSAILTVAVLGLPYETMNGKEAFSKIGDNEICDTYVLDLTASASNKDVSKPTCSGYGAEPVKIKEVLQGKKIEGTAGAVYGIMNIYTYQIMKVDQVRKLFDKQITGPDGVKEFTSLAIKVIFDLLFIVVFLILMVALFMALFARGTWLWIHAMFSPVFGLLFFFGKGKEGALEGKFGPLELIKLALVPVYVSAALAFGLIFIFVASNGLSKANSNGKSIFGFVTEGDEKVPYLKIGGFKLVVKGKHGGDVAEGFNGISSDLGNGLGQLILELFGLAILWIAVMAALKSSKITGEVIAPIEQFGKSVGSLIAKSPQYAPIIPTGKGGMMSTSGLNQVGSAAVTSAQQYGRKSGDDFMKENNLFGQGGEIAKSVNNAAIAMKNYGTKNEKTAIAIGKGIDSYKRDVSKIIGDNSLMNTITQQARDMSLIGKEEKITDQMELAKVIGKMEYVYQSNPTFPGEMFGGHQKLTNAGYTKDKLKESYKESQTATDADITKAKQNTAINIKNINNNTVRTQKETGGGLSSITIGGVELTNDLGDIIDVDTGDLLKGSKESNIKNILKTKSIKINGTDASEDQLDILAKQILAETINRMKK